MDRKLLRLAEKEEARGKAKWGVVDTSPAILIAAAVEELGEAAHAYFHDEGPEKISQEIAETIGILSRLHDMSGHLEEPLFEGGIMGKSLTEILTERDTYLSGLDINIIKEVFKEWLSEIRLSPDLSEEGIRQLLVTLVDEP